MLTWNTWSYQNDFPQGGETYFSSSQGTTVIADGTSTRKGTWDSVTFYYTSTFDSNGTSIYQNNVGTTNWITAYTQESYFGNGEDEYFSTGIAMTQGYPQTIALTTSTTQTATGIFNTSSTFTETVPIYTSSIATLTAGDATYTSATSATATGTVTLTNSSYSYTYSDFGGIYTASSGFTSTDNVTSAVTTTDTFNVTGPYVLGTVVSAENEWLWSITAEETAFAPLANTAVYIIADIADSFTLQTFWPGTATQDVTFGSYTATGNSTYANPDSYTTVTYNTLVPAGTSTATITSGDYISRAAMTTTYQNYSLGTSVISGGVLGNSFVCPSAITFENSVVTNIPVTQETIVLFPINSDYTTISFTTTLLAPTTLSFTDFYTNSYLASFSSSATNDRSRMSSTIFYAQTNVVNTCIDTYWGQFITDGSLNIFEQVNLMGACKSPASMAQTDAAGTNLSINPAIYYPFTSSVVENVTVPVPLNTTATNSGSAGVTSWSYSWSGAGLSYTSQTTNTAATSSFVSAIAPEGNSNNSYFQSAPLASNGYQPFGGYCPVASASQVGCFPANVYEGTIYGPSGVSSTFIATHTECFTSSASVGYVQVVEGPAAYQITTAQGLGSPYISYTRNG